MESAAEHRAFLGDEPFELLSSLDSEPDIASIVLVGWDREEE